ncbi:MAG: hypothetical protein ROW48_15685 [Bellilinea sp.]
MDRKTAVQTKSNDQTRAPIPTFLSRMIPVLTAVNGEVLSRRMGFGVEKLESDNTAQVLRFAWGTCFVEMMAGGGK